MEGVGDGEREKCMYKSKTMYKTRDYRGHKRARFDYSLGLYNIWYSAASFLHVRNDRAYKY